MLQGLLCILGLNMWRVLHESPYKDAKGERREDRVHYLAGQHYWWIIVWIDHLAAIFGCHYYWHCALVFAYFRGWVSHLRTGAFKTLHRCTMCVVCVSCRTPLVTRNEVICMYFRNGFTHIRLSYAIQHMHLSSIHGCRSAAPLRNLVVEFQPHNSIFRLVAVSLAIATICVIGCYRCFLKLTHWLILMASMYQAELTVRIVNATPWEHNAYNVVVGTSI